jgi:hypothetical protein
MESKPRWSQAKPDFGERLMSVPVELAAVFLCESEPGENGSVRSLLPVSGNRIDGWYGERVQRLCRRA